MKRRKSIPFEINIVFSTTQICDCIQSQQHEREKTNSLSEGKIHAGSLDNAHTKSGSWAL